jgi:hypothetical protein
MSPADRSVQASPRRAERIGPYIDHSELLVGNGMVTLSSATERGLDGLGVPADGSPAQVPGAEVADVFCYHAATLARIEFLAD